MGRLLHNAIPTTLLSIHSGMFQKDLINKVNGVSISVIIGRLTYLENYILT